MGKSDRTGPVSITQIEADFQSRPAQPGLPFWFIVSLEIKNCYCFLHQIFSLLTKLWVEGHKLFAPLCCDTLFPRSWVFLQKLSGHVSNQLIHISI